MLSTDKRLKVEASNPIGRINEWISGQEREEIYS
jgi:hypothetical protein